MMSGQLHTPAASPPGKEPHYALNRGRVAYRVSLEVSEEMKISSLLGFKPQIVQTTA